MSSTSKSLAEDDNLLFQQFMAWRAGAPKQVHPSGVRSPFAVARSSVTKGHSSEKPVVVNCYSNRREITAEQILLSSPVSRAGGIVYSTVVVPRNPYVHGPFIPREHWTIIEPLHRSVRPGEPLPVSTSLRAFIHV